MSSNSLSSLTLPAEWEPQDAVILAWPYTETDWRPVLNRIHETYITIIKQITRFEYVVMILPDESTAKDFSKQLDLHQVDQRKIITLIADYNDTWLRDSGPVTVIENNNIKHIDFRFNGWGGKFNHQLDDQLCQKLFSHPKLKNNTNLKLDIILEGGSIDSDGHGVLLTTKPCLLNENRNPTLSQKDYEELFASQLGIKKTLWLEHGMIMGDDTDGHIDMLARFCPNNILVHCACHDKTDPHYEPFKNMTMELQKFRDSNEKPYKLVELPIPKAIMDEKGKRLPASYCNFLIINQAVLLPVYNDEMDNVAIERLSAAFPDREIIPVNATTIIRHGGSLHCLTMQLPAGSLS